MVAKIKGEQKMKDKKATSKIISILLTLSLSISSLLCLSSCLDTREAYIVSAVTNASGELVLTYSDGRIDTVALSDGGDTSFVINGEVGNVAAATTLGLSSAVSIAASFTKTVQNGFGGWFPGFGSGNSYTTDYSAFGSGVIYKLGEDGDAMIITNYHVIYDSASNSPDGISEDISVFLYGSESAESAIKAEYVGGSLYYDIAVLHVKSDLLKRSTARAVSVSDNEVSVGNTAIAIGNPEASGISATLGIVSVDSEYITMTAADGRSTVSARVIRIDTAVNSGNSGGGLYNDKGELIGIVNAKISDESVENIAFAIPVSVAVSVADNIIDNCYGKDNKSVLRATIGATLASSGASTVYDSETGLLEIKETVSVGEVSKGSLADGSLEVGDVLISATVGDRTVEITRQHHLIDLLLTARDGDTLKIELKRSGVQKTVEIKISSSTMIKY